MDEVSVKAVMELKSLMKQNPKKKKEIQRQIQAIQTEQNRIRQKEKLELEERVEEVKVNTIEQATIKKKKKRRDKMAEFEEERQKAFLEQQEMVDHKQIEHDKLALILQKHSFQIKPIAPDGHCLYNSILNQFNKNNLLLDIDYKTLRKSTAEHIRNNKLEFIPFLCNEAGDMLNDEEFDDYLDKLANGAVWGGQIEIQAISYSYMVCIHVFQAGTEPIEFNPDGADVVLNISYHKHEYGLGEHYNSLIPI
jgi:OTU domain-containing protein 6